MVVGEDHEAAVGTDEEETSDTKHIPPDGSDTFLVNINFIFYASITWRLAMFS